MKRFLLQLALVALSTGVILSLQPPQQANVVLAHATLKPATEKAKSEPIPKPTPVVAASVVTPAPTPTPTPAPVVTPPAPTYPTDHVTIMAEAGISSDNYGYVDYIVSHESGWRSWAQEPNSGAYGLCQSLPGGKMATAGADWASNPVTQMSWCNSYAVSAYGSWYGAYIHWVNNRWW